MDQNNQYHQFLEIISSNKVIKKTLKELGFFAINYPQGTFLSNNLWTEWGYKEDEMSLDHEWIDNIHPEDRADVLISKTYTIEKSNCDVSSSCYRFKKKNGKYAWVLSSGKFISFTPKGEPEIYMGTDIDISNIKKTELELYNAKKKAEMLVKESDALLRIGAVISSSLEFSETSTLILKELKNVISHDVGMLFIKEDKHLKIVSVNSNKLPIHTNLIGKKVTLEDDRSFSSLIINYKKSILCNDIEKQFPDFKHFHENNLHSIIGVPLIARNKIIGIIAIGSFQKNAFNADEYNTISKFSNNIAIALDNSILHEKMSSMALTDALTNLNNRHGLSLHCKTIFEQANRYKREVSLIIVDIDHFKIFNDKYGHDVGDKVIQIVSNTLVTNTRSTDIVSRFGGEEFVIVLPETNAKCAYNIADTLRSKVETILIDGIEQSITISLGISTRCPEAMEDMNQLIKLADEQLYFAKNNGRNLVYPVKTDDKDSLVK